MIASPMNPTWRDSISLRLMMVSGLALVLLIPMAMVGGLIEEREGRRQEAIDEVGSKWGHRQVITGPVLHVPFRRFFEDAKGKVRSTIETSMLLPETLRIQGDLVTEVRTRGIYEVMLYTGRLDLAGSFAPPVLDPGQAAGENVLWDLAYVTVGVSDPRGLTRRVVLNWDGQDLSMGPGDGGSPSVGSGISRRVPVGAGGEAIPFAFILEARGNGGIHFAPTGGETRVTLRSSWPHPSFSGGFLPRSRSLTPDGFEASWKVLDLNRSLPQSWVGGTQQVEKDLFGVDLIVPVDGYRKSDRAHKYGFLFIAICFLSLFFVEILKNERVHPLNYLLIGLAICLFYVLLLSISEHLDFDRAYGIAATATTLLVTWHAGRILVQSRRSRSVGAILAGLYSFLWVILQLDDLALLVGSVGLFALLGAVMWAAGHVSWTPSGYPGGELDPGVD